MKKRRKIIVYIATSADGYIARPDGNVDWLNQPRSADDYGMGAFYQSIDTVIWGPKTYEPLLQKFASGKAKATARSEKPKAQTQHEVFIVTFRVISWIVVEANSSGIAVPILIVKEGLRSCAGEKDGRVRT